MFDVKIKYFNFKIKFSILQTVLTPIESGYWWVRSARSAVKLHSPAVNRMKKGSSFFG